MNEHGNDNNVNKHVNDNYKKPWYKFWGGNKIKKHKKIEPREKVHTY